MFRTLLASTVVGSETLASVSILVASSPFTTRLQDPVVRTWSRGILWSCGVELTVEGAEHVDPAGRYIFISNHQSHLDIPCLSSAIPCSIRYVAKRSLFRIPVFGQGLRSIGTVCVDRGNKQYSKRKMEEARRGIGQRVSLLFFAEGTRSRDGRLGPFKSGGVAMALALGIPVVPVAIAGTWAILPKGFHLVRPGPARVAIGKPIEPGPNTHARKEQLLHEVHDQVASLLERMDRTSGHRRAETRRAGRA